MTQVELPQLSLQRYVDLVKRRRWQLLPVSALGLMLGALVAFLIPRYFVADTLLEHQAVAGQMVQGVDDPLLSIVDSAKLTIPQAVPAAMEKLRWPEALIADPFEKTQKVKEVQLRVAVYDANPERGRRYAQIRVVYRDQDGERAATFLNTLVEVWMEKRLKEVRDPEDQALKRANQVASGLTAVLDTALAEKYDILRRYGLRPDVLPAVQQGLLSVQEDRQQEVLTGLRSKEKQRDELIARMALAKEALGTTPERIEPDLDGLLLEAARNNQVTDQVKVLFLTIQAKKNEMDLLWTPGSRGWKEARRGLAMYEGMLRTAVLGNLLDADGLVPNPRYEIARRTLIAGEEELKKLDAELLATRAQVEAEKQRLEDLRVGYNLLERKNRDIAEFEDKRKAAVLEGQRHQENLAALERQLPVTQGFKAVPPPRPTDPNIAVVALIGCVLGLAFAVGLILLLDFLQGSFKTADDVERGLSIPVLGGMSHLETAEERVATVAARRRVSVAAFGFVALVVVVVTIFYVDPTRLPHAVRDLLAMLLGS